MADPLSCPTYDEDMNRSYVESYHKHKLSPAQVAQAESRRLDAEVESLDDFSKRIEGELNGMGIKAERIEVEEVEEEAPNWF